jgi:hypothetical protein
MPKKCLILVAANSVISFAHLHRISRQQSDPLLHITREAVPESNCRGQHPRRELPDLHPLPTAGNLPVPNARVIRNGTGRHERRQHQVRHVGEEHHNGLRFLTSVAPDPGGRTAPRHDPAHPEERRDLLRRELTNNLAVIAVTRLELHAAGRPGVGAGRGVHAEQQRERLRRRRARAASVEPLEEAQPPGVSAFSVAEEEGGDGGAEAREEGVEVGRGRGSGGQEEGGARRGECVRQRVGGAGVGGVEQREGEGGGGERLLLPLFVRLRREDASGGRRSHGRRIGGAAGVVEKEW